jgi:pilus assembly protein FimV
MEAQESMGKPQWRATALAIAAAALLAVPASDANALALGRVTVQSALGEPLRADIDIPDINAEEVSSLRASLAAPDAFKAAGFEYNSALQNITITLMKRPDGRYFLQLTTRSPVNDPFIDLIIEANWSAGRIVRDYTMLFDPPSLRQPAPLAAQVSPVAPQAAAQPGTVPRAAPAAASGRAPSSSRSASSGRAPAAQPATAAKPASGESKQVTVQPGDTAGKIAAANKPPSVSLDQMLVAMLRSNPDAFIGGNVNRLRAGAVIDIPAGESAGTVPSDEASQTIVAQSRDFNEFRRRLAEGLPTTRIAPADRQSSGKVQARVEEKKPSAAAPDKLTLSKGAVQGKGAADQIARDRAAKDAAARVAELNKNISDLNKLTTGAPGSSAGASAPKSALAVPVGGASAPKAAAPVAAAASKPAAVPVPAPAAAVATAASKPVPAAVASASQPKAAASVAAPAIAAVPAVTAAAVPASSPASATPLVAATMAASAPAVPTASASSPAAPQAAASTAAVAATVAASSKPAPKPAAKPAAPLAAPETSFLDDLLDNPFLLATVGAAVVLLAGFGFYRVQQRKKSTQVDSSFLESRLQPDSFFGASGGQRIDTNEGNPTGSSMVYSPSQLDAAGDVDPVAEADVYLAYGRDLQAEEILKEAMRTTPQRVAVHSKLLEIYAKRRDTKAFELVATEAYGLTHGAGPEWEHICELGQELDSSNPLYRPGGQPSEGAVAMAAGATGKFGATTATQPMAPPVSSAPDVDLDLDFSIGDDEPAAAPPQPTLALNVPPAAAAAPMPSLDMDFGSATVALEPPAAAPAPSPTEPARLDAPDLMLPGNSLNFDIEPPSAPAPAPQAAAAAPAAPAADPGMIEFDLGALSLDLDAPAKGAAAPAASSGPDTESTTTAGTPLGSGEFDDSSSDPLATKLALAQEFNAIGDPDGARSLAQEVIAEASGDLKNKAQRFLAEIG